MIIAPVTHLEYFKYYSAVSTMLFFVPEPVVLPPNFDTPNGAVKLERLRAMS